MSQNTQLDRRVEGVQVVATSAIAEIVRGEVDMQVATAKQYPRNITDFQHEVLSMATIDRETAAECTYAVPRAGSIITGPSIRFAEILACAWGNIREEKRSLEPGRTTVTGQGTAWDLQRNRLVRVEVSRRITGRNGKRYGDDMIATTANAAASIAHRNAILACVPKAFWKKIHDKVQETAAGDAQTLGDDRAGALGWFERAGISAERVFATLKVESIEDIGLKQLATLQGFITASREDSLNLHEAFPDKVAQEAKAGPPPDGTHKIGGKKPKEEKPEPETAAPTSDLAGLVLERINAAKDLAELEAASPSITEAEKLEESGDYERVNERYEDREAAMEQQAEDEATRG